MGGHDNWPISAEFQHDVNLITQILEQLNIIELLI